MMPLKLLKRTGSDSHMFKENFRYERIKAAYANENNLHMLSNLIIEQVID